MATDGSERLRIRETTPRGDYAGCLAVVADLVARLKHAHGPIEHVGVGIPGSIEPESRRSKGSSSTWLLGQEVEADLREAVGTTVRVVNDADCIALSESRDGAGEGFGVVFVAAVGSGIGGGIAIDGKVHHGPNNSAAEWGHSPLPLARPDELPGRACYCGKSGCMETWVSGRSFEALFEEQTGDPLKAMEIMARVRAGDAEAALAWGAYVDRLARGLSVVVNTLDPDIIVVGGGISDIDELYDVLPAAIASYTFSTVFNTPVRRAAHGGSSGVRGAAWLWAPGS
jgi:fructokinase